MLSLIKDRAKFVADNAVDVAIAKDKIAEYLEEIDINLVHNPFYDADTHYQGSVAKTASYIIILDAINFGSGYFRYLKKDQNLTSGYFHLSCSLKKCYEEGRELAPDSLESITSSQCATLFAQDIQNPELKELMELFARAWNELGSLVNQEFSGSFVQMIESAEKSADKFMEILSKLSSYQDKSFYKGLEIPFYKRAQITISDLALAFEGKGLGLFHDLDQLTVFADNRIPQVLNLDGILKYSDELTEAINSEEEITKGSSPEIEIRACAIHACELIKEKFKDKGISVNSPMLDNYLWHKGQRNFYKSLPTHQTRQTTYY